jgi:hypothetical protein
LPQGFASLRAGVIKFASLADDDWSGTDNQNFLDVSALGHLELNRVQLVVTFDLE